MENEVQPQPKAQPNNSQIAYYYYHRTFSWQESEVHVDVSSKGKGRCFQNKTNFLTPLFHLARTHLLCRNSKMLKLKVAP